MIIRRHVIRDAVKLLPQSGAGARVRFEHLLNGTMLLTLSGI